MKVAIDISQVVYEGGVPRYTDNLVRSLVDIVKKDEILLFGYSLRKKALLSSKVLEYKRGKFGENVREKILPVPLSFFEFLWNRLHILPVENLIGKVDLFHSSDWIQPPSKSLKVTTVHDLIAIKFPKITPAKIVSVHSARMRWVLKEVDKVIVPSKTTAYDCEEYGIKADKIEIIPEACDPVFKPAKKHEIERIKRKYKIFGDYILGVGVGLRKNTQRIIEAYEKIKPELDLKLIFVGNKNQEVNYVRGVFFLGNVAVDDLVKLYSGALALVYPSLYEGFGLPILESFSCKTPVVTSNSGSLAELGKKGAFLVDPYSVDSIAEGILSVIKDREKWVKKGVNIVKKYSWEKTAEKTLKVYKSLFS